jgi:hypothetical protein
MGVREKETEGGGEREREERDNTSMKKNFM